MPTISLHGTTLVYTDADVITFDEGLIGMPRLRRMAIARHADIEPFHWLVSIDDARFAFLSITPQAIYPTYSPRVNDDVRARLAADASQALLTLATATIHSDWTRSTINLRAPIVVSAKTMRGVQVVLGDSDYRVDEPLPTPETV